MNPRDVETALNLLSLAMSVTEQVRDSIHQLQPWLGNSSLQCLQQLAQTQAEATLALCRALLLDLQKSQEQPDNKRRKTGAPAAPAPAAPATVEAAADIGGHLASVAEVRAAQLSKL